VEYLELLEDKTINLVPCYVLNESDTDLEITKSKILKPKVVKKIKLLNEKDML